MASKPVKYHQISIICETVPASLRSFILNPYHSLSFRMKKSEKTTHCCPDWSSYWIWIKECKKYKKATHMHQHQPRLVGWLNPPDNVLQYLPLFLQKLCRRWLRHRENIVPIVNQSQSTSAKQLSSTEFLCGDPCWGHYGLVLATQQPPKITSRLIQLTTHHQERTHKDTKIQP